MKGFQRAQWVEKIFENALDLLWFIIFFTEAIDYLEKAIKLQDHGIKDVSSETF